MDERWDQWLDELGGALTLFASQFVWSHADAEESVQDGFIRFWNARESANDPKALLFTCVKRAALDLGRRDGRRRRREDTAAQQFKQDSPFVCPIEQEDRKVEIELAMASLPDEQREVLVMKIWGHATFAQVAAALDISPNTAASRYRYAIVALRKQLSETMQ